MPAAVLCWLLACSLMLPSIALADVRKTDILVNSSVEDRGLSAAECPSIDAQRAYVVDSYGNVFFSRDADAECNIASITKIMTAIVALETGTSEDKIEVSQNAASVGESTAGLRAGDVLAFQDALYALMVPSGNDAAIALAETLGRKILDEGIEQNTSMTTPKGDQIDKDAPDAPLLAFVWKMNRKASELGCKDTLFENPHGLDAGEFTGNLHSTAKEVSIIAAYAMQMESIRSCCDKQFATISVERGGESIPIELESTDLLIGNYEGACGIKTGKTDLAGPCFAGACARDGRMLYSIVLDSSSEYQRFQDTKTLWNWVFDNEVEVALANTDEYVQSHIPGLGGEVPVIADVSCVDWIDKQVPATLDHPEESVQVFRLNGNVSQDIELYDVSGGVKAGDVVGHASFYQRNELLSEQDLIATCDVAAPNIFESIGIWWERTFSGIPEDERAAPSVIINEMPTIFERQVR